MLRSWESPDARAGSVTASQELKSPATASGTPDSAQKLRLSGSIDGDRSEGLPSPWRSTHHISQAIKDKASLLEGQVALAHEKHKLDMVEGAEGDISRFAVLRDALHLNKDVLAKLLTPVGQKAALAAVAEADSKKEVEEKAPKGKGKGAPPPPPKGKGKGKGKAPPPPTKGKGKGKGKGKPSATEDNLADAEEKIRKPEFTPGVAMRPLFWNSFRIPEGSGEDTVWLHIDRLQNEHPDFNAEELERHFGVVKHKKFQAAEVNDSSVPARQVRVFEEGRRRQILVMLRRLPEKAFPAILRMDDSALTADQVSLLLDNLPQKDELALIAKTRASLLESHEQQTLDWEPAEEFILELSMVPQFSLRLRLWHFMLMFQERYTFFSNAHANVQKACKMVRSDVALHHLLRHALFVGNYMNAGTHRGRADGFNVEILTQMKNVKSVGKDECVETLIDFLVRECTKSDAEMIDALFQPESVMEKVSKASRFKLQDLRVELNSLAAQANSLSKQTRLLNLHERDALRDRGEKLDKMCDQLQALQASMDATDSLFMELKKYYEVDFDKSTDEFFSIWENFLKDVQKSVAACQIRKRNVRRRSIDSKRNDGMRRTRSASIFRRCSSLTGPPSEHVDTPPQSTTSPISPQFPSDNECA